MRAIYDEIQQVAAGDISLADSVLRNAPHTAHNLVTDWDRAYSREQAVYPFELAWQGYAEGDIGYLSAEERVARIRGKYWPPVTRIDNAYGDRNLVCACPPPEAFA